MRQNFTHAVETGRNLLTVRNLALLGIATFTTACDAAPGAWDAVVETGKSLIDQSILLLGGSAGITAFLAHEAWWRMSGNATMDRYRNGISQEGTTVTTLQDLFRKNPKLGSIIFDDGKRLYYLKKPGKEGEAVPYTSIPLRGEADLTRYGLIRRFMNKPDEFEKHLNDNTTAFDYDTLMANEDIGPELKRLGPAVKKWGGEKRIWTRPRWPWAQKQYDRETAQSLLDVLLPLGEEGGVTNASGWCHLVVKHKLDDLEHIVVKPLTERERQEMRESFDVRPAHMKAEELLEKYIEMIDSRDSGVIVTMALNLQKQRQGQPTPSLST